MTWHVSPEEWLLDFTSVPHGRVRAGESLDSIDDRLRTMLAPSPPKVGLIMPSITATRGVARGAPEPGRGRERSQPVLVSKSETVAEAAASPEPHAPRTSVLDVELLPMTPTPGTTAADMVMPSLTRPASEEEEEEAASARGDEDEASALDRLNPVSGPELGIPADDADDLMSALASGAPMAAPMSAPVVAVAAAAAPTLEPPVDDEPEEVEDGELEAEPIDDNEPTPVPEESSPPIEQAPAALLPLDERPTLLNIERLTADKPAPPRPPPVANMPAVRADKPSPPRPPEKPSVPPPPTKAAPPPPSKLSPAVTPVPAPTGPRKRGWYDEAFGEHYGSITPLDSELSAELDAAFIRKAAELGAGQTLLDVGCGDGRHCFALANLGLMVSGLDCSLAQLVRASQRNEAIEAGVTLLQGDMRALPRDRQYDVVTCLGSTLGYFESEDQNRQSLQEMVEVLRPGGKLVLHVFNRDYLVAVLPCRSWWQGRGCLVLDVADMNYFTNRIRIHRTVVFEDGRQFEHHMYIWAFSLHELGKMLATMGMRVLEASGSRETRGKFYGATSPEIWLVAQRRDDI